MHETQRLGEPAGPHRQMEPGSFVGRSLDNGPRRSKDGLGNVPDPLTILKLGLPFQLGLSRTGAANRLRPAVQLCGPADFQIFQSPPPGEPRVGVHGVVKGKSRELEDPGDVLKSHPLYGNIQPVWFPPLSCELERPLRAQLCNTGPPLDSADIKDIVFQFEPPAGSPQGHLLVRSGPYEEISGGIKPVGVPAKVRRELNVSARLRQFPVEESQLFRGHLALRPTAQDRRLPILDFPVSREDRLFPPNFERLDSQTFLCEDESSIQVVNQVPIIPGKLSAFVG